MKRIDVTCAIIIDGTKILACQRKEDSDHPLEWEFPGGKIYIGESATDCIIREIKEELDIDIVVEKSMKPIDFDYPAKHIKLIPFVCRIANGQPLAIEHNAVMWIEIDRFDELHWSAADKKLFQINKYHVS
jgi:8-oxo-dGTP diphosphatase